MRRSRVLSLSIALLLPLLAVMACRQSDAVPEYSATVVVSRGPYRDWNGKTHTGSTYRAKAYVTSERARVDFEPSPAGRVPWPERGKTNPFWGSRARLVLSFADQSGWEVDPEIGEHAEDLDRAPEKQRLQIKFELFSLRPGSVSGALANPCSGGVVFPYPESVEVLQILLPEKCTPLGEETLHGRRVTKWEARRPDRRTPIWLWVDRNLELLLKVSEASRTYQEFNPNQNRQVEVSAPSSTYELVDLKQKKQKPSLFDRPPHFVEK